MTTPDWIKYIVEGANEHLDISTLLGGHGKVNDLEGGTSKERRVGFAGTDYGVCKMGVTVPQSLDQIETHLNRYQVLAGLQDSAEDVHHGVTQVEVPSSSAPAPLSLHLVYRKSNEMRCWKPLDSLRRSPSQHRESMKHRWPEGSQVADSVASNDSKIRMQNRL
ncbi:MAG: hypothetical protein J3Q66DRAFT_149810 [Benniella sp.]|nr:MAG: hypothetical protein J3Q66DRAFT_149810 [Benniella sp.]